MRYSRSTLKPKSWVKASWLQRPQHGSDHRTHDTLYPTETAGRLRFGLHLQDPLPSLFCWRVGKLQLLLAHSLVDIYVLNLDVQRALLRNLVPRPHLPYNVQGDEEGARKVVLEEGGGVEIWPADRIKGDIELGGQANKVQNGADIGAPNTEYGLVGELIDTVALKFPTKAELDAGTTLRRGQGILPCGSEADVGHSNTAEDKERRETGKG